MTHSRHALEEDVAVAEHANEDALEHVALADDDLAHLLVEEFDEAALLLHALGGVARVLGPTLFGRIAPLPDTSLHRRLMALDHELMTVRGGRAEATRAFNTLVPLTGDVFHRRERLGEVKPPTVYLWGENDGILPVSLAEAAVRAQPSARLVRVRTRHSPHLEQPECLLPELRT